MDGRAWATIALALGVGGLVAAILRAALGVSGRLDERLRGLNGGPAPAAGRAAMRRLAREALPRVGTHLMPDDEDERSRLRTRLIHAGCYGRQALPIFLGAKLLVMFGPPALGALAVALGLASTRVGLLGGIYAGGAGLIAPGMWLDRRKRARQAALRRALPDALDLLVICVEGGLTLAAALVRVVDGLGSIHPGLAAELEIARREMQLGSSAGEALRHLAERADMEEIRGLASVVIQSERFGAGLAKSLRVHAETLRLRRQQRAEELAQKAATKVLVPTLFCIFPAIFVVVLGPAMIQISKTLGTDAQAPRVTRPRTAR